ncbi:MAG: alpha/beta hydrolase [Saprospiraceae bacterium]
MQKTINLTLTAPYHTYGKLTNKTETIIVAFHGYGQLTKYFIHKFDFLDKSKYYVIAPQGLSKFYLKNHTRVGASWMTKENRLLDLKNQLHYVQTVFEEETKSIDWSKVNLNVLGFSQGTATASRWTTTNQIAFDKFIAYAGQIAYELTEKDFDFMKSTAQAICFLGNNDQFYHGENLPKFETGFKTVFPKGKFEIFEGKHEVLRAVLKKVL